MSNQRRYRVRPKGGKQPDAADRLFKELTMLGAIDAGWSREVLFHHKRQWKLDIANAERKIGIEVDGYGPSHYTVEGRDDDNEKRNAAVLYGWRVLVVTADEARGNPAGVAALIRDLK